MSHEEKMAIQALLLDELARQQATQPTLLIDALLGENGYAFIHHTLTRRLGVAQQDAQITGQLLKSLAAARANEEAA